jgi:hypothetical protein
MRRLILVMLGLAVVGLAVYRERAIGRSERDLAIGPHAPDTS